jgi:hypothetical protein
MVPIEESRKKFVGTDLLSTNSPTGKIANIDKG